MRIAGGSLRGRRLTVPEGRDVRPTLERVREAVFDRLIHGGYGPGGGNILAGAVVLDAFAGSGAMALEAISRGAAQAVCFDPGRPALSAIRGNIQALGLADRVTVLEADATRPPALGGRPPARLVFLDPPYGEGLIAPAVTALLAGGWIAPDALLVAETARKRPDPWPDDIVRPLSDRRYGDTIVALARIEAGGLPG